MLLAGQQIDRYQVEALLGQGGMAQVYRVRHLQLGTERALKVLMVANPTIQQRLLQEGRLQASLEHPNIVAVSDVIDLGGASCLLMEYVAGPSLQLWLSRYTPPLAEALALFRPVVTAVGHAHCQGFIHRDLKPANVLLAPGNGTLTPKVADFGLAKALADELMATQGTRTGAAMGTPAYMSPEQIRDSKSVGPRSDLFALGCILFELACGRLAFGGTDLLAVYSAISSNDYASPRDLVPDLPELVVRAIDACLAVEPDERPESCEALLELLGPAEPVAFSEPALDAAGPPAEQALPQAGSPSGAGATAGWFSGFGSVPPGVVRTASFGSMPPPGSAGTTLGSVVVGQTAPDAPPESLVQEPAVIPDPSPAPEPSRRRPWVVPLVLLFGASGVGGGYLALDRVGVIGGTGAGSGQADVAADGPPSDPVAGPPTGSELGTAVVLPVAVQAEPEPTPAADELIGEAGEERGTVVLAGDVPPANGTSVALMSADPSAELPDDELAPGMGRVSVTGDAEQVVLLSSDGSFSPGIVPSGTYRVQARFPGGELISAGQVVVPTGKEVTLRCTSGFFKCVQS